MIGRYHGREILEQAMIQALAENRVDSERIRQLIAGTDTAGANQSVSMDYLGQSRVVLPDLGQFDRLRATVAVGGSE
jgi:hypothetical protein